MRKKVYFLFCIGMSGWLFLPTLLRAQDKVSDNTDPASSTTSAEQAPTTDEEIQAISERLKGTPSSSEEQTRSAGPFKYPVNSGVQRLLPDISLIGNFAGAYFSREPSGETGVDPARTGFTLQEVELAVQSVIDPYFRADAFIAFAEDEVALEEAYVTTLAFPKGLQMRAGKFRIPFGRQNQKHTETWDFADTNLINKLVLGADGLKEIGVEISYLLPIPFFLQAQGTFTNGQSDTSFGGTRKGDFLYQGRLTNSFDLSTNTTVLLGTSGAFGYNSTGTGNRTKIFGGDVLIKWKPKAYRSLIWQSEYLFRSMQEAASGRAIDDGFYTYLAYQFVKRWQAGLRYDQVGRFGDAILDEYRITPALTFNPTEFSRIRCQYEFDNITSGKTGHAAIVQLEFSMGPHGAHPF